MLLQQKKETYFLKIEDYQKTTLQKDNICKNFVLAMLKQQSQNLFEHINSCVLQKSSIESKNLYEQINFY